MKSQKALDIVHHLCRELGKSGWMSGVAEANAREVLRALLVSMPAEQCKSLSDDSLRLIDDLLASELADKIVVDARNLPTVVPRVVLWRGDMSLLKADAVVNPNNEMLLGCFEPAHRCLDNILHAQAGPRLRISCFDMKKRLNIDREPTGQCRVTPAHALPATYMFHTVGPCLGRFQKVPTEEQRKELQNCYLSCMNATLTLPDVKTVAFCCISTGIFGYPAEEGAFVACSTVKSWLDAHPDHPVTAIFNVFLESDHEIYKKVIPAVWKCK